MNYERIILEMLSRIQELEDAVAELKKERTTPVNATPADNEIKENKGMNKTEYVKKYILDLKEEAREKGETFLILTAGDVQKEVNMQNRIVIVCNAMKQVMNKDDVVMHETPSGYSTTYQIKYYL